MTFARAIPLALLALLPLAPLVAADSHGDCDSKGTPAMGEVDMGGGMYMDDRNYSQGNGVWIYQESNGEAGLQRGGSSSVVPDDNEICTDDSDAGPDTLIF